MIIGITGSFGSGKTTVSKMFRRLGAYIIDADRLCHSLMRPSNKVYKKIIKSFGSSILKRDKSIDRKKLAKIVFNNRSKLNLLNKIVHPEAIKKIKSVIKQKKKRKSIIIDAALLLESGFYKDVNRVIVVKTKRSTQLKRLKNMRPSESTKRIRMQAPIKKKLAHADFIIDNSGSKKKTFLQVKKIWKTIRSGLCA